MFPVETSQWKFVFHIQISRLYHQSHTFRGLLSGPSAPSNGTLPKRKFPIEIRTHLFKQKTSRKSSYLKRSELLAVSLRGKIQGFSMVSWLVRSSPDRAGPVRALAGGHCVVFLGKTLYSHSTSLHPGV